MVRSRKSAAGSVPKQTTPVETFDDDGDLMVTVGSAPKICAFILYSNLIKILCPAWSRKMHLDNNDSEVNVKRLLLLPDDDASAFAVVMDIAHYRDLPSDFSD